MEGRLCAWGLRKNQDEEEEENEEEEEEAIYFQESNKTTINQVRVFRLRIAIHIKELPISAFLYSPKQGCIYSPKSLGTIPKF